jgi:hypothetical protein
MKNRKRPEDLKNYVLRYTDASLEDQGINIYKPQSTSKSQGGRRIQFDDAKKKV